MADDDLLTRASALHERSQQIRAQADQLRGRLNDEFQQGATDLGIARDRALRANTAAQQAMQDADAHVTSLEQARAGYQKDLADSEAKIAKLRAEHDDPAVEEAEERTEAYRRMVAEADGRVRAAKLDAAETRETAGIAARHSMEAQQAYDDHYTAVTAAEKQIDRLEDQSRLIEQARMKLVEADIMYGGDPPADADIDQWVIARSTLEVEADDLVEQAEAIRVDLAPIAVLVPEADDPPPAPVVNDTDLIDPFEDQVPVADTPVGDDDASGAQADETSVSDEGDEEFDLAPPPAAPGLPTQPEPVADAATFGQPSLAADLLESEPLLADEVDHADDAAAGGDADGADGAGDAGDLDAEMPDALAVNDTPPTDWAQFDAISDAAGDVWAPFLEEQALDQADAGDDVDDMDEFDA